MVSFYNFMKTMKVRSHFGDLFEGMKDIDFLKMSLVLEILIDFNIGLKNRAYMTRFIKLLSHMSNSNNFNRNLYLSYGLTFHH